LVTAETVLADLGLDSLSRLTLGLRIDEVLGVPLPDEHIVDATTVADLAARVDARRGYVEPPPAAAWALRPPARVVRELLDRSLTAWSLAILTRARTEGLEYLVGLRGPVLVCPNHASHLDAPLVRLALPSHLRRRATIAAAADYWFARPLIGSLVALALGAFPFGRTTEVRASVERVGDLLGEGWSVILFPEGTRSQDGTLGPIRDGIGLVATSTGAPVVPVWIAGTHDILPKGRKHPRRVRGDTVVVRFGAPIHLDRTSPPAEAARIIGEAIAALGATHRAVD
jgi:1-acyl-sn-glycerol-3-phosphate acyltransferase